jgi:DNA-binding CsgD family transcriptional regulator
VLIAQGLSNSEMAAALFLSADTVKTHVNQAIRYAHDHGHAGIGPAACSPR